MRLLLALFFALGTAIVSAEEPLPPVPDPQNLAADWWVYFEPKEPLDTDKSRQRLDEAQTFMRAYRDRLQGEEDATQVKLVEKILAELLRFQELKFAPAPVDKPAIKISESYSLDNALQRHAAWRTLKQEVEAEREETNWQASVLAEERKQQSRRRTQYLELDNADAQKTGKGLELMLSRLGIELRRLEFDRRKTVLRLAEERLESLRAELDAIPERLVTSAADDKRWQQQQQDAEKAIASLREQIDQSRLFDLKATDPAQGLSEAQYAVLVAVRQDVDIRVNELLAMQARIARMLIEFISHTGRQDIDAARGLLAEHADLKERLLQQRDRWWRIAERGRSVVGAKALEENGGAEAVRLRTKVLRTLDEVDDVLLNFDQQVPVNGFLAELLKARRYAAEGWFNRNVTNLKEMGGKTWSTSIELMGATLFEINETPVTSLGLLRVVLILTIALWLSKGIRKAISRVGEKRGGVSQSSLYTFGRLIHYLVLTIGIIIGLSSIGIDFTKFALFASALGVGIGFGLQTLISNFVAGLIILFERSLKVGDFVELESGVTGEVNEINMRSTLITTNDNVDILVPNSEFVGGRVINWTLREAYRRIRVPFGVAYGTDKDLVKKAALEAAERIPWTLQKVKGRHPQVWFVEFGDSSLNFELVVWLTPEAVKRPGSVQAAYLWEIETKLNEYGIEVPFPQRDLHLRSMFGLKDDNATAFLSRNPVVD
jgi:small-conductance mechanosensitive channel